MNEEKLGFANLIFPHSAYGTYSVSFWFCFPALLRCFLFSGFSFGKMMREAKRANPRQETRKANVTRLKTLKQVQT
ncbi:MAG: hypothetical protein QM640_06365 [Niabella sp.]